MYSMTDHLVHQCHLSVQRRCTLWQSEMGQQTPKVDDEVTPSVRLDIPTHVQHAQQLPEKWVTTYGKL
jgi:hypothetical protein